MSKAYKVFDCRDDDVGCEIVFARTAQEARKYIPECCANSDYIHIRAKREPSFDDLAGKLLITARDYHERGWYTLCGHCEKKLFDDNEPVYSDCGLWAYCSKEHKSKEAHLVKAYHEQKEARNAQR